MLMLGENGPATATLTRRAAAELLTVSEGQVRRYEASGRLPGAIFVQVGRVRTAFYSRSEVERLGRELLAEKFDRQSEREKDRAFEAGLRDEKKAELFHAGQAASDELAASAARKKREEESRRESEELERRERAGEREAQQRRLDRELRRARSEQAEALADVKQTLINSLALLVPAAMVATAAWLGSRDPERDSKSKLTEVEQAMLDEWIGSLPKAAPQAGPR